eukprot:CAMPEP_0197524740 /NCGR_PEP_ID=MMETSP1318-20131121/9732_1 /TAXON_ID=552666 /ORGANISM="Partenskyella glossopodia, Strain RCC365" /LENGTH=344 /DNA_ID=CAMNT_0043077759 /DNA_START=65 /DNA_END=1099 /DNA_ORIENTATION=-
MEMTPEVLKDVVKKYNGYSSALELNDKLYAHFRGFDKIENLEPYTGLKCLYLEKNAIGKIEGIEHLKDLSCLYIQENMLKKIEGLANCTKLYTLNVSHNFIRGVEGLRGLDNLNTLIAHHNDIKESKALQGLLECPRIAVLDLSENKLEHEDALDVLGEMSNLKVLYLKGNPFVKRMRNYRKRVIARFPKLTYLDDRPVFDKDRKLAEAWARGGKEAEREERGRLQSEEREANLKRHKEFYEKYVKRNDLTEDGKQKVEGKIESSKKQNSQQQQQQPISTNRVVEIIQDDESSDSDTDDDAAADDLQDIPNLQKVGEIEQKKLAPNSEVAAAEGIAAIDLEDVE